MEHPSDSSQDPGADGAVGGGSPGAPVTASSRRSDRSGPVPGIGTLLKFSLGMQEQPQQCPWKWKVSRRRASKPRPADGSPGWEEKLGSGQGCRHRSTPSWELTAPAPAHRCQKAEQRSPRNCQQPGASQSSAKNSWQDTPEHAQDHKSSCYGATNQPAALQDEEGGKVISLAGPGSISHNNRGWPGSDRIPGLTRPPDLRGLQIPAVFAGMDGK